MSTMAGEDDDDDMWTQYGEKLIRVRMRTASNMLTLVVLETVTTRMSMGSSMQR